MVAFWINIYIGNDIILIVALFILGYKGSITNKTFFFVIITGIPDFNINFFAQRSKIVMVVFVRKMSHFMIYTKRTVIYAKWTVIYTKRTVIHTKWTVVYTKWTIIYTKWTIFYTKWTIVYIKWTVIYTKRTVIYTKWTFFLPLKSSTGTGIDGQSSLNELH